MTAAPGVVASATKGKERASMASTQLIFSSLSYAILLVDTGASLAVPLLFGGACAARELARYENPLRLSLDRILYAIFWTLPAPFCIPPYKPIVALAYAEKCETPFSFSFADSTFSICSFVDEYAWAHFVSGHKGVVNLSLHAVALAVSFAACSGYTPTWL